jgi:hypothetical protein
MGVFEQLVSQPLSFILENNKTELMGYAFQIFSLFVSRSHQLNPLYDAILQSLLQTQSNWGVDMKYLIPSMTQYLIAMICKYPEHSSQHASLFTQIVKHLMTHTVRMETSALEIASVLFERLGLNDSSFLNEVLLAIFQCLHFYRNSTKNQSVPLVITKQTLAFFATVVVNSSVDTLVSACDSIQPGIMFMVLNSLGDQLKFCSSPARIRKYTIVAFSQIVSQKGP